MKIILQPGKEDVDRPKLRKGQQMQRHRVYFDELSDIADGNQSR